MGKHIFRLAALAAFTLGWLGSVPAWGAALTAESYESAVGVQGQGPGMDTRWGPGWHPKKGGDTRGAEVDLLTYPVAGNINPDRGTVELEVVRDNGPENLERFFSLVRADGKSMVQVGIWWSGKRPYTGQQVLQIKGFSNTIGRLWYRNWTPPQKKDPVFEKKARVFTTNLIPLPKQIAVGQKFHLAFTWGPALSDCNIYLDGQRLNALKQQPFGMKEYIQSSSQIVVGGTPASGGRAWAQPNSVIKSFHIYDAPLGSNLFANPALYRPETASPPAISSLGHDAARVAGFSGKLVAGDTVTVSMEGAPGAEASFDVIRLPDLDGNISLDWKGYGVYLEERVFFEEDEIDLRDVEEYRVYVSRESISAITEEMVPVETLEVGVQSYTIEDLEFEVPHYVAVVAVMRDESLRPVIWPRSGLSMVEDVENPGRYEGSFEVGYQDRFPRAVVVGRLARGEAAVSQLIDEEFEADPALNIAVLTAPGELKADEESTAQVTVTVTDANGDPISDHEVRFVLATTSSLYTGVVGGGTFTDEVGGSLSRDFRGVTDLFGQVTATYTAGFAAKTAIIVARDMVSNDTGVGYVKTYIQATAELELEAVQVVAGKAAGFAISVVSSDEWLTADGESQARITAQVTQNGHPVEGHRVGFTVTAGAGSVRTVSGTTDSNGKARAVYTAGKKIGMVLITAVDHTAAISASVQIELRSDAPAKIAITISPETLDADGSSTADLVVLVTDINDNPNDGVEVEYRVAIGGGRLRGIEAVTDRNGESSAVYVAGRVPGKVSIEVTVRSTVPTEEELTAARDLAVSVTDFDFF